MSVLSKSHLQKKCSTIIWTASSKDLFRGEKNQGGFTRHGYIIQRWLYFLDNVLGDEAYQYHCSLCLLDAKMTITSYGRRVLFKNLLEWSVRIHSPCYYPSWVQIWWCGREHQSWYELPGHHVWDVLSTVEIHAIAKKKKNPDENVLSSNKNAR
jgi:hypothetical protein